MSTHSPCPGSDEYRLLLAGSLAAPEEDRLTQHLEACARCAGAIRTFGTEATLSDRIVRACARGAAADPSSRLEGKMVGDYELLAKLGGGGMGVVYQARQRGTDRLVAIKMIRTGTEASQEELRRFRAEADAMKRLDHPAIVPIYAVGEYAGAPYFAMQYVADGPLSEHLSTYQADLRKAALLVAQVARAVQHAHDRNILHRDLKPANILLTADGHPRVADFGLAKCFAVTEGATTAEDITRTGAMVGTPAYMAPEQASGADLTPAVDIHALGAVLYVLLTGRPPFQGTTVLSTLDQVRSLTPAPPGTINPEVPRDLAEICLRCLEKKPGDRYPSAAALADDLERWAGGQRPLHLGWAVRLGRWIRHHRLRAALLVAVPLVVVALLACWLVLRDTSWERVQARGRLRVGINLDYPPMDTYDEQGEPAGFDVDLARALAKHLDVECEFASMGLPEWDWPEVVRRLNANEFDVLISAAMITEKREKDVTFLEYLRPKHYLIFDRTRVETVNDLQPDHHLAVAKGTGTVDLARELQAQRAFVLDQVPGNEAPFVVVKEGKAVATLAHHPVAAHFARKYGLQLSATPVESPSGNADAMGFVFRKHDAALLARMKDAWKQVNREGERARMKTKWGF